MIFSEKQLEFLESIDIFIESNNEISDDEIFLIEDEVSDLLQRKGFDSDYQPTELGLMCESILDVIGEL